MALRAQIESALRLAEAESAEPRAGTLRLLMAAVRDRDSDLRRAGAEAGLDEAGIRALLARLAAQRRETAAAFEEAGRLEQAAEKAAEAAVIEEFLPRRPSEAEIARMIDAAIAAEGARSLRDIGRVMAELKPRLGEHLDPAELKALVRARFD